MNKLIWVILIYVGCTFKAPFDVRFFSQVNLTATDLTLIVKCEFQNQSFPYLSSPKLLMATIYPFNAKFQKNDLTLTWKGKKLFVRLEGK